MLYLNVSERVMNEWGRTIDLYYSLHMGGVYKDIKSINLLIEEESLSGPKRTLYRCSLGLKLKNGEDLGILIERENCGAGIEQCFAKAKRHLVRRIRGMTASMPIVDPDYRREDLSNLAN